MLSTPEQQRRTLRPSPGALAFASAVHSVQVLRRNCLESDVKFQILSNPEFLAEGVPPCHCTAKAGGPPMSAFHKLPWLICRVSCRHCDRGPEGT